MNLTFEGYVKHCLEEKTGVKTASIQRLVSLALSNNDIMELVFIFAIQRNKKYHLISQDWNTPLEPEYRAALRVLGEEGSLEAFLQSKRTPVSYRRIYTDFLHYPTKLAAQKKAEGKDIERLRQRTVAALKTAHITRYRVCTDLGLNPGNVYAYLAGNTDKVSLKTAQAICDYAYDALEKAQAQTAAKEE